MKQHLVLVPATAEKKKGLFSKETVEGYKVVKSTNYPAKPFYTIETLDKLTDMGITYEINF